MKTNNLFGLFCLLLCAICFSCTSIEDNLEERDYTPIVLQISIHDEKGNDLLNRETPDAVINRGIIAIHRGIVYKIDAPLVRAYLAEIQGLNVVKGGDGKYFLTFGEFGGNTTYENEEVILDWSDGTRDVISFSNKLIKEKKGERIYNRSFYLNGEEQKLSNGAIKIIKHTPTPGISNPGLWKIADIRYAIEADKKDEIENHLKSNAPFAVNDGYIFQGTSEYSLLDAQKSTKESGTFIIMDTLDYLVPPASLAPSSQIIASRKFVFNKNESNKRTCFTLLVKSPDAVQRYLVYDLWMYEDLTDYYKTHFPDAGVKRVIRLHVSKYYLSALL